MEDFALFFRYEILHLILNEAKRGRIESGFFELYDFA